MDLPRSLPELLDAAEHREPLEQADGKSGARLERLQFDGRSLVIKHLALDDDWTMRTVGDVGCASLILWNRGVLASLPDCIRQPIIGVYAEAEDWPPATRCVLVMEDVGEWLVPDDDSIVPAAQHLGFIDHLAAFHAHFASAGPEIDLVPMTNRYLALSLWMPLAERTRGADLTGVPLFVEQGWPLLREVSPAAAAVVEPLSMNPSPLVAALEQMPQTFVHGNWKFGNLGTDDLGRTVLFDWEEPGRAPGTVDLAWYLALNCARLPISKEMTITAYQAALESHGVEVEPWFDTAMELALLGALVQFGWEKALGGPGDEMDWWTDRAVEAARLL